LTEAVVTEAAEEETYDDVGRAGGDSPARCCSEFVRERCERWTFPLTYPLATAEKASVRCKVGSDSCRYAALRKELVRGLVWGEVEFSVVKEDRDAEVGEVAVAAGDVLEGLDRGVKALGGSVGNLMPEPRRMPSR
jgi:hypothetical protein